MDKVIKFLDANGWKMEPKKDILGGEYTQFHKANNYDIDIDDNEVVFIDDTGDFLHLNNNSNIFYTVLGALIHHRALAIDYKLDTQS